MTKTTKLNTTLRTLDATELELAQGGCSPMLIGGLDRSGNPFRPTSTATGSDHDGNTSIDVIYE